MDMHLCPKIITLDRFEGNLESHLLYTYYKSKAFEFLTKIYKQEHKMVLGCMIKTWRFDNLFIQCPTINYIKSIIFNYQQDTTKLKWI